MSKKCTPLWREAHFQVKMYKAHHCRTTFGSCNVEKVRAVVARSRLRSQNVQNTSKHTRCGPLLAVEMSKKCTPLWHEAHISKSKCKKDQGFGPLLEVQMSKKCTLLWREAHFEVNMYKAHHVRTIFGNSDVEKVHAVVARSTFPSQHIQNTACTDHFWSSDVALLRFTTLHYTTLHYTTLHYTTLHNATTTTTQLHSTTQNYTTLNYATLHYIALHYTPLHYTTFHYITLHSTTTATTPLHSTTLHYIHQITLHYTPLH